MVPTSLHDFFIASASTSAALIGLLFVAVSIAPERIFGTAGDRTYRASSAFFVLGNGLFISLGALLPQLNLGTVAVGAGLVGLLNTAFLILDLWQRGRRELGRGLVLATGSFAIYGGEVWNGVALLRRPDLVPVVELISYFVLGGYLIGLARAWELVGGHNYSLLGTALRRGRISPAEDEPDGRLLAHLAPRVRRPSASRPRNARRSDRS